VNALLRDERTRQQAHDSLDRLDFKDGRRTYAFSVKIHRRRRSLPQNNLYWMLVAAIAAESAGYDLAGRVDKNQKQAVHRHLRNKFLQKHKVAVFNEPIYLPQSTTELNTAEFTQYLDDIYEWAREEHGIMLPRPDDLGWESFCQTYADEAHG